MFSPGRTTQPACTPLPQGAEETVEHDDSMRVDTPGSSLECDTRVIEMESETAHPLWTEQMTVVQLRAVAKQMNLASSGTKQQLIHRLSEASS